MRLSSWVSKKLIGLIRIYQRGRSEAARGHCRFTPTCSQYAIDAISRYGVLRGGLKAVGRILRCNPLSKGGYDPVR
ncbi:MAG: membrane protein insertion efficiency factor YidD [Clostridiaceae bacterium]|nr:membrane protein insertion efficiency factor YidD [Clostridiaceae bacterium]